jgi:hypothetical protein
MDQDLIAHLKVKCKPVDEIDDALVYKIDALIAGRWPHLTKQGADHILLYDDDTYEAKFLGQPEYRTGALLRELQT